MPEPIKISSRRVWMHKGVVDPNFGAMHVLSDNPWQFVELYLTRAKSRDALDYWKQARRFAEAAAQMSAESAPLAVYYSFLNASKALLCHKKVKHDDRHGVAGDRAENARASLANEKVKFQNGGVLPSLCKYFNETAVATELSLRDILWNLPFIHRAFCLSFTSATDLFIPLERACYVRHDKKKEAWFQAEIVPRFSDQRTLRSLPSSFETWEDNGKTLVRRKKRFDWYIGRTALDQKTLATKRLKNYHATTRRVIVSISGDRDLWYLKKEVKNNPAAGRHTLTLMFAAMHRLSELSRYDPGGLDRHLSGQANWLLVEFINHSLGQFIDQIASEPTFPKWPAA